MKDLLIDAMELQRANPWWAALFVYCTQYIFLWSRTRNVIATAQLDIVEALWTGLLINICWLVGIALGVDAIATGHWQPIVAHIFGGLTGVYLSLKRKKREQERKP